MIFMWWVRSYQTSRSSHWAKSTSTICGFELPVLENFHRKRKQNQRNLEAGDHQQVAKYNAMWTARKIFTSFIGNLSAKQRSHKKYCHLEMLTLFLFKENLAPLETLNQFSKAWEKNKPKSWILQYSSSSSSELHTGVQWQNSGVWMEPSSVMTAFIIFI